MTGMGSDTSPAATAKTSVAAAEVMVLDGCSSPSVSVEVVFEDDTTGAAGDQQLDAGDAVDVEVEDVEEIPENCSSSLGFTAAQEVVFSNGRVDGQRVMVLNSEVARSLGVSQGSDECPDDITVSADPQRVSQPRSRDLQVTTAVTDDAESQSVSVSLAEFDDDGMLDPDQFLEMELASGKAEVAVDEDLTSLSWLQSRNLLKDIQLRPSMPGLVRLPAGSAAGGMDIVEAAVTAAAADVEQRDLADLNEDDPGCQMQSPRRRKWQRRPGGGRRGSAKSLKQTARTTSLESGEIDGGVPVRPARRALPPRPPPHVAYNPQIDVMFKPPFSFSCLIFMAIEDVPVKAMPVRDIYDWISSHFPFYNSCSNGWKNSVRHNLSLNQCFCKVDGVRCCGKGSLWAVDPLYRTSLLFTLRRSKCVSEQPLVLDGRRLPWASAVECGPSDAVAVNTHRPSCPSASSPGGPLQALQPDSCSDNSPQLQQPLSQHARIAGKRRRYLSRTDSPPVVGDVVGATCEDDADGHNIANPELFPFLARRLGYSSTPSNRGRHRRASLSTGPVVHPPLSSVRRMVTSDGPERANRTQHGDSSTPVAAASGRGVRVIHLGRPKYNDIPTLSEKQKKDRLSMRLVVISRSPADEHTYAAVGDSYGDSDLVVENLPGAYSSRSVPVARKRRRLRHVPGGAPALRQIYDDAGRRFVDEGADLLLNLAAGMSRAQSPASCSSAASATASGARIPAAVAVASSASWDSYDIGSLPTAV